MLEAHLVANATDYHSLVQTFIGQMGKLRPKKRKDLPEVTTGSGGGGRGQNWGQMLGLRLAILSKYNVLLYH